MTHRVARLTGAVMALTAGLTAGAGFVSGPATASTRTAAAACTSGAREVGGALERTFCGPATVTVTVNGKSFKLSQGQCVATPKYISVNIGVLLARPTGKRPNYFGLDVGAVPGSTSPPAGKDGTYKSGITLALTYANKSYTVDSDIGPTTATLSGNRTRGTVTGKALTGETLTAKFHC
jgi:hypothetical protein